MQSYISFYLLYRSFIMCLFLLIIVKLFIFKDVNVENLRRFEYNVDIIYHCLREEIGLTRYCRFFDHKLKFKCINNCKAIF